MSPRLRRRLYAVSWGVAFLGGVFTVAAVGAAAGLAVLTP